MFIAFAIFSQGFNIYGLVVFAISLHVLLLQPSAPSATDEIKQNTSPSLFIKLILKAYSIAECSSDLCVSLCHSVASRVSHGLQDSLPVGVSDMVDI